MKLSIQSFKGIAPRINPRYLPDGMGRTALNCEVVGQSLRPNGGLGTVPAGIPASVGSNSKTLYLYNAQGGTKYWFDWNDVVDVAPGQIAGDTDLWVHYSGDSTVTGPRSTYFPFVNFGSGSYPRTSVPLGVPTLVGAPSANKTGNAPAEGSGETPETRVYTATLVRYLGSLAAESAPSAPSNSVEVYSTQTAQVTLPELPSSLSAPTGTSYKIRLYRATAGVYLYVGEFDDSWAGTTVADNVSADVLGEELPSLNWTAPPNTLTNLINLPNGGLAGSDGKDIRFAEPYRPYAWPEDYAQTLDYDVVGLGAIDTTLVAVTTGYPYLIQGATPDTAVVVRADLEQACLSKRSIVSAGGAVFYASPDGLVRIAPNGSDVVSKDVINQAQWQSLNPASMHAYQHELQLLIFWDNGTDSGVLVYDLRSGQFFYGSQYVEAAFRDLSSDNLYVKPESTGALSTWGKGSVLTATYRSKVFTMPQVTGFSCGHVEAEAYPLTCKVYLDGALLHTQTVTSRLPFRLPAKQGRDWEIELLTDKEVFSVALAQSMAELASG